MTAYVIALEGIDGTGKTSIAKCLQEMFIKEGKNVVIFKHPSEDAKLLLKTPNLSFHEKVNIYSNDFEVTSNKIKVLIDLPEAYTCILDRWIPSLFAYQLQFVLDIVYGYRLPNMRTAIDNSKFKYLVETHVTFVLLVKFKEHKKRLKKRSEISPYTTKEFDDIQRLYNRMTDDSFITPGGYFFKTYSSHETMDTIEIAKIFMDHIERMTWKYSCIILKE